MIRNRIGVIGSINTDLVSNTDILPNVGETVAGKSFDILHGGKGANQAIAASRLNASVNLIGCVGDDDFSKNAVANLLNENVHITAVKQLKGQKCGVASITVCNKNNSIIVMPGANQHCDKLYVKKYLNRIKECNIVGAMFEVPTESIEYASEYCKSNNIDFVLNPSPIKSISQSLFDNSTFIIVNEVELTHLDNYSHSKPYDLLKQHANKLILTLGKSGVMFYDGKTLHKIPSIKVTAIDTTGAGDTFLGAFMVGKNNGLSICDSIMFANICAGLKTTKLGAQTGMPTLTEVKKYIKKNKIDLKISF